MAVTFEAMMQAELRKVVADEAAAAERAKVVAWLRESEDAAWIANTHRSCLDDLADHIEALAHLQESKP